MPQGKFGIREFTTPTTDTNPKHLRDVPHEGDPFCGNDNNRRSQMAIFEQQHKADPESFDHKAAMQALGGSDRVKRALNAVKPVSADDDDEPEVIAPTTDPVDGDDDGDADSEPNVSGTDEEKAAAPKKPAKAPKWNGNA